MSDVWSRVLRRVWLSNCFHEFDSYYGPRCGHRWCNVEGHRVAGLMWARSKEAVISRNLELMELVFQAAEHLLAGLRPLVDHLWLDINGILNFTIIILLDHMI